jgi:hypothetical protein
MITNREQFMACIVFIIMVLFCTSQSNGQVDSKSVVGYWLFDEGSGSITKDSSGHGYDADLKENPLWVEGKFHNALEFQGQSYLEIRNSSQNLSFGGSATFSITAWVKNQGGGTIIGKFNGSIIGAYILTVNGDGTVTFHREVDPWTFTGSKSLPDDEFGHVAVTYDGAEMKIYVNGEFDSSQDRGPQNTDTATPVLIGARFTNNEPSEFFNGVLDDVALFNVALTEQQIRDVMFGLSFPKASSPEPEDGAFHKDTWVSLSWSPGDSAASHDVYLGENLDDVFDAARDSAFYQGNQTETSYTVGFSGFAYPDGLVPGVTYYWRIDEVNDADPNSPWKGDVWSFSVPPKKAYRPDPADGADILDLDDVKLSWTAGYLAILHTVYIGNDYDEVSNTVGGMMQNTTIYNAGKLEAEKVYYWRVDEFDGVGTYKGDIWTFTTPGAVGDPQPANGATDVPMATILSWTAADTSVSHQMYLGPDKDAVRSADTGSPEYIGSKTLGDESYDPGLLELGTIYYWRVDEVYNGYTVKGPVWSFKVANFLILEDFEDYDAGENQIWYAWHDGLGYGTPGSAGYYAGNGTGAAIGDETTASYTEEVVVHRGSQSMPVAYDNNKQGYSMYSEVEKTLNAQRDWTASGVGALSLWFKGSPANDAEPLYVAISNGTGAPAVVIHDDSQASLARRWSEWIIPLEAFADQGLDLTDVTSITVGIGTRDNITVPGGSGKMHFDDIRLYLPGTAAE